MMGVGKSTIGPELAARLGCAFLDTDEEVERRAGRSIADIFESEGEAHFRELEAQAIDVAAGGSGGAVVIALGGGAVAQPGAVERLRASGDVVFLEADPEELVRRIEDGGSRPLLAGLDRGEQIDRLRSLLSERMPFYAQAHHRVDAAGGTFEVVDRIVAALQTG
jgi:shikimate kinase